MTTGEFSADPTRRPAWRELTALAERLHTTTIRELLDAGTGTGAVVAAAGIHLDTSRQRVTDDVWAALGSLALECDLPGRRAAMLAGEHINVTEDRAVLHTALRLPSDVRLEVDGVDVVAEVHAVLARMRAFATAVRDHTWRGATGEPITAVVNIGIGGSDLGPAMAHVALGPRCRVTSSRCRPTRTRSRRSASTPRTCSASGTGSAGATRWTRRSA